MLLFHRRRFRIVNIKTVGFASWLCHGLAVGPQENHWPSLCSEFSSVQTVTVTSVLEVCSWRCEFAGALLCPLSPFQKQPSVVYSARALTSAVASAAEHMGARDQGLVAILGLPHKSPPTWWLKAVETDSLRVGSQSQKSRCRRMARPPQSLGRGPSCLVQLLGLQASLAVAAALQSLPSWSRGLLRVACLIRHMSLALGPTWIIRNDLILRPSTQARLQRPFSGKVHVPGARDWMWVYPLRGHGSGWGGGVTPFPSFWHRQAPSCIPPVLSRWPHYSPSQPSGLPQAAPPGQRFGLVMAGVELEATVGAFHDLPPLCNQVTSAFARGPLEYLSRGPAQRGPPGCVS